jgi:methylmalonyl-CoA mutase N-terminal domain/subunit
LLRIGPELEEEARIRLRDLRTQRDQGAVAASLLRLQEAAKGDDNLLPPILEAVRAYATLGEISDQLRSVFGEYRPQHW